MMTFNEFKDMAFAEAAKLGCEAAEIYFTDGEDFSVNVLRGELDTYSVEHSFGVNLRVKLNGRDGYAYTEILDDPAALAARAADNAKSSELEDDTPMQGKCEYPEIETKAPRAVSMTPAEKIAYATELEKKLLAADPRVARVYYSLIQTGTMTRRLVNTLGLDAESRSESVISACGPIMIQDGVSRDAFALRSGDDVFDVDGMIKEAVEKTVEQFGASPVPSGKYRALIRNEAMSDMLMAFSPMFSADAAQKGMSLLAPLEGQVVAAECVTLTDDPLLPSNPRAFDGEGVPSVTKKVIDRGVLTTLLHNLKTAKKAGVASTSNAGRGASDPVSVSPSNFFIEAGEKSYEELIAELKNGLIITQFGGLHAGLNPVSGDFSLIAKGLLVEDGKIIRSVDQITLAGNFLKLMKEVRFVGSDLKFGMPSRARFGSPSLLVGELMVSGS